VTRPRVVVTGPDRGGGGAWWLTRLAIERAGGRAARVTPSRARSVGEFDALVLGGGADIHPELYGAQPEPVADVVAASRVAVARKRARPATIVLAPAVYLFRRAFAAHDSGPDRARDALESSLLREALRRDAPVLGICRGAQMINVALGGDLHPDLAEFYVEAPQLRTVLPKKTVRIEPGSHLARAVGGTDCAVNALHHQAVRKLGDGLTVVAREANGVVQAIEHGTHTFVVGVQWHPEYLPQHPRQRRLFEALVAAARQRMADAVSPRSAA
jgi:putative glutamine amidotransferase